MKKEKRLFLDLGDGTSIPMKKVVLILNADSATMRETTRKWLRKTNMENNTVLPKKALRQVNSLVLTNAYGKDSLYSSSRSSSYLADGEAK